MIPAGYVASIVAWATRPDLTTDQVAARKKALLDEQDALVTGQVNGGKAVSTLTQSQFPGKIFMWSPDVTAAEKLVVISDVLRALGLLSADSAPTVMTFGAFNHLQR